MSTRSHLLKLFSQDGLRASTSPLLLLDLTLWHKWRRDRAIQPDLGETLVDAARALGTPAWAPFRPWRTEYDGVEVTTEQTEDRRDIVYRAPGRTLLARWTRGPDGDWWQTEYPVKTPEDLQAAVELAAARRYVLDLAGFAEWRVAVGEDGVVPLELPMRPYSDVLHTMIGWGDGLALIMGEGKPMVTEIVAHLERASANLMAVLAGIEGDLIFAPDNLDGQYISPRAFKEHLGPGYAAAATTARSCGKHLVVHTGGPARRLLPLLAAAGVDAIEGVAGAPQGDATLAEARESAGPEITLWGGIPQDLLLTEYDQEAFEAAAREAIDQAGSDPAGRSIVGVADRVPPGACVARLHRLVELIG